MHYWQLLLVHRNSKWTSFGATLWGEYKNHYTSKVLVALTPNGATSYVSLCYVIFELF